LDDEENDAGSAKDRVNLKRVETRRQEVKLSQKEIEMMQQFEQNINPKTELSNDEITIINIFEKQRLFITRILIKFNQTRAALGMPLFKTKDIQDIVDGLVSKQLVTSAVAPNGENVYFLTEAGKDFLDII
jgi:predicted transcriptional regulator